MPSRRRHERGSRSDALSPTPETFWALAWNERDGLSTLTSVAELRAAYGAPGTYVWIDLDVPDKELLDSLDEVLGLHPLVTEDILERNQRAKVEVTGDALHIVMFALRYEGEVVAHELDIVLGERFLLTSHDAGIDLRNAPFMRRNSGAHLAEGPDFVLWMVSDWLVDEYFPVFDRLGDEIDGLSSAVRAAGSSNGSLPSGATCSRSVMWSTRNVRSSTSSPTAICA